MKKSVLSFLTSGVLLGMLLGAYPPTYARCLDALTSTQALQAFPPLLTSSIPPQAESLEKIQFENLVQSGRIMQDPMIGEFFEPSAREQIQRIFEKTPENSTYVFIGNGMYPIYVFAKGLATGRSLQKKIHFLALSSPLVHSLNQSRPEAYFRSAGLDHRLDGPLVVIDTIGAPKKRGAHQVQIVSEQLRNFYQIQFNQNIQTIPVGVPEGVPGNPKLMRDSWQEVAQCIPHSPSDKLILDLQLPMNESIFYPTTYGAPRWNGDLGSKFDYFRNGVPASREDPILKLVEEGADSRKFYEPILRRMEFLYNMSLIFNHAKKASNSAPRH